MEIPSEIIGAGCTAIVGMQAWTLSEIIKLKTRVAVIAAQCPQCNDNTKSHMKPFIVSAVLAAVMLALSGCGTLYTKTPGEPVQTIQPVYGLATNAAGVPVIAVVGQSTNQTSPEVWTLNSNALAAVQTVQAVNAAVPSPVQPLVNAGLGLFLTLAGLYGAHKTRKLTLANAALTAVVAGVEVAGSPAVKQAIQGFATANGSQSSLDSTVQSVSESMPTAAPPKS